MTDGTDGLVDGVLRAVGQVPDHVARSARLHLLDAFGVAMAAAAAGPVQGVVMLADDTPGPSTVLGTGRTTSPAVAALVNGTLMHSLEYDDTHVTSVVHGSSVLAAAALAVAEEVGATGRELVDAFAVGWELLIRIGLASPGRLQANGFQVTAAGGAFAAAAVSALLHGDDPATLADAIGIAGSQAGGTFAFLAGGDTVKAVQPGWAAHAGVMAEQLARAGVTGPRHVFDGPFGFYRLYAHDPDAADRLLVSCADLGTVWHLPDAAFKLLPCCHYLHPFVEAMHEVLDDGVDAADVVAVHCEVPSEVVAIIAEPWPDRQHPRTAQDARWSLPYVLGLVLCHGRVDAAAFVGDVDELVVETARTVQYTPWEGSGFPARFPARVRVRLRDGSERTAEVLDVLGSAGRPVGDEAVLAKARNNLCAGGLSPAEAEDVVAALLADDIDLARLVVVLGSRGSDSPPTDGVVMTRRGVAASGGESDRAAYSAAIRVGDLVFVSGQVAMSDDGEPLAVGDFHAQAEVAFGRLRDVLVAAGSGLEHVAKVTIHLTDRANVSALVDLRRRWFSEPFPADTTVVVASLARPEWLIEIDAVAVLPHA